MFEHIGEKLKKIAEWVFIIGAVVSVIATFVAIAVAINLEEGGGAAVIYALIDCVGGIFGAFVIACLLYAFGTITNTYIDISNHIHKVDGDKYKFTPGDEVYYGGTKNQEHTKPDEYSGYKFNPKAADESDLDEYLNKARKNIK